MGNAELPEAAAGSGQSFKVLEAWERMKPSGSPCDPHLSLNSPMRMAWAAAAM